MFYGWYVVGCAFLVALWGWGLGFYGPSIYLVALQQAHAWSTATVSVAITAYYLMGALVIVFVGDARAASARPARSAAASSPWPPAWPRSRGSTGPGSSTRRSH